MLIIVPQIMKKLSQGDKNKGKRTCITYHFTQPLTITFIQPYRRDWLQTPLYQTWKNLEALAAVITDILN